MREENANAVETELDGWLDQGRKKRRGSGVGVNVFWQDQSFSLDYGD